MVRGQVSMRRRRKQHPITRVLGEIRGTNSTVIVTQCGDRRSFRFADNNELIQGTMHQRGPLDFRSEYLRGHLAASTCHPKPRRALCLGLGIGAVPRLVRATHHGIHIDSVECNDTVIQAAHEYFKFPHDSALTIHHSSAQAFVENRSTAAPYDLLYLDCYDAAGIPAACATPDFLEAARSLLSADGVMVANLLPGRRHVRELAAHVCAGLNSVWSIPCVRKSNITLFGTQTAPIDIESALVRAMHFDQKALTPVRLVPELERARPWSPAMADHL